MPAMSMWRGGKGRGRGEVGLGEQESQEAREAKRERRGQAAPFIVSGHWGGTYLATAR